MCFSAGASFSAGVVLTSIGVATAREAHKPSIRLFASVPLFFAFQQFSEGVIWMNLRPGGNESFLTTATYVFLFMALIAWPVIIPLSTYRIEEKPVRKRIIGVLVAAGLLLATYYAYCLVNMNVWPRINKFHIQYINNFPEKIGYIAFGVYAVVSIAPLFISSFKRMSLFGYLAFFSCLVTGIFYKEFLTSVWCFFAALMSIVIYVIVRESQEEFHLSDLRPDRLFAGIKHK
jgi:hypothetical protein